MRELHHDQVARLFARALEGGARRLSMCTIEWDIAGDCQAPVVREIHSRPSVAPTDLVRWRPIRTNKAGTEWLGGTRRAQRRFIVVNGKGKVPLTVILHAKCRKCEACLRKRAAHWRLRAYAELGYATRTWFGTLTLSPGEQFRMLALARADARRTGLGDFDALPPERQWQLRVATVGVEITKYLKRVREASGSRFRYLIVSERHKSGDPHFHMLLHEVAEPVREAVLSKQWRLGFCQWRLAHREDQRAATYLTKYISKSAETRVRASARYGRGPYSKRPIDIGSPQAEGAVNQKGPQQTAQTPDCSGLTKDQKDKVENFARSVANIFVPPG